MHSQLTRIARPIGLLSIALGVSIALAGCFISNGSDAPGGRHMGSGSGGTSDSSSSANRGSADAMFTMMMIPHHEQAIEMADIVLAKDGVSADIQNLAERIKAAQQPEIELMESWLDEWDMQMPGLDAGMGHGGMMSSDDLDALRSADGATSGDLFLTQMIEHHEGAIDMATDEIEDGSFAPTVELAERIVISQSAEIDEMRALLQ